MSQTRGVLFVHSAPSALCPHVEWAVGAVFGAPVPLTWTDQPAERGTRRAELSWTGPVGTSAAIASALRGWDRLRFEVTEEPTRASEGVRYSCTPTLGVFQAQIGLHGDILVPEGRLSLALVTHAVGGKDLATAVDELLGRPWDDELEAFRHAGDGAPVRWLHRVG